MRVLVIGSGLAGVNAALLASEFADVTLLSKQSLDDTNTRRAQGGIAAAVSTLDDPDRHAEDTIRAGEGLCETDAVRALTRDGPAAIERLLELGVEFDRQADGQLALATEGAHSMPRVLHVGGDQSGRHIQSALLARLGEADVDVRSGDIATELALDAGRCVGVNTANRETIPADAVVLATGGAGALYRRTTNPGGATADGVALAARAGALLRDLEFVQFHPTALAADGDAFLVSEALRGEGAVLLDASGDRFMLGVHADAELAPRSVVAGAISETMRRDGVDHVMLDISHLDADYLRGRFPGVHQGALERGHDLTSGPIPVAPAAHYHMGGVYTDIDGRTTVPGLLAVGECASTGAHGANRVASNSLLEAVVFSTRAVNALRRSLEQVHLKEVQQACADVPNEAARALHLHTQSQAPSWAQLRGTMNELVGIARTSDELSAAIGRFDHWSAASQPAPDDPSLPLATLSARLITQAALEREETRGAHIRLDHPQSRSEWRRHSYWRLARE